MERLNWCELNKQYFDPDSCSGKNGLNGIGVVCVFADEDGKCQYIPSTTKGDKLHEPTKKAKTGMVS